MRFIIIFYLIFNFYVVAETIDKSENITTKSITTEAESSPTTEDAKQIAFDHSHSLFTKILKDFTVVSGPKTTVNYKDLKNNSEQLNKYLHQLSAVTKKEFDSWPNPQQQAFLINAYNAFTLKLIIKNYPLKSIKKIGGFFTSPWKIEFFSLFGKKAHLDYIEHEMLRKNFDEPRVHFAVNCASIGCPALRGEAYTGENLNKQLNEQTKLFLRDSNRNKINTDQKQLKISKIFDWFKEDFEKNGSTVSSFIAPFIVDDIKVQNDLKNGLYSTSYLSYDWGLNETK